MMLTQQEWAKEHGMTSVIKPWDIIRDLEFKDRSFVSDMFAMTDRCHRGPNLDSSRWHHTWEDLVMLMKIVLNEKEKVYD